MRETFSLIMCPLLQYSHKCTPVFLFRESEAVYKTISIYTLFYIRGS